MTGQPIAIEGPDGIGKTTVARLINQATCSETVTIPAGAPGIPASAGQRVVVSKRQVSATSQYAAGLMEKLAATLWHSGDDPDLPDASWTGLPTAWFTAQSASVVGPLLEAGHDVLVDGWFYKFCSTAAVTGDLRLLNTACKPLGGASGSTRLASPGQADPQDLAAAAAAIEDASATPARRLAARLIIGNGPSASLRLPAHLSPSKAQGPPVTVLASSGSATARRLTAKASAAGVTVSLLYWYSPRLDIPPVESGHAEACYPPKPKAASRDGQFPPASGKLRRELGTRCLPS